MALIAINIDDDGRPPLYVTQEMVEQGCPTEPPAWWSSLRDKVAPFVSRAVVVRFDANVLTLRFQSRIQGGMLWCDIQVNREATDLPRSHSEVYFDHLSKAAKTALDMAKLNHLPEGTES